MISIGDCLEVMRTMDANSVDAVVTDPPYGIRFMGKAWDGADIEAMTEARRSFDSTDPTATVRGGHKSLAAHASLYDLSPKGMRAFQEFSRLWGIEAMRVMKPGAHLVSFASPRTYHRMVCGLEEAGLEIRDQLQWIFGSGFPKSHNLDGDWEGWGTALKPAFEPIVLARKPLVGTVAANVRAFGTGALNIAGCRVGSEGGSTIPSGMDRLNAANAAAGYRASEYQNGVPEAPQPSGRWPANLIHDGSDEVVAMFPNAPGQQRAVGPEHGAKNSINTYSDYGPQKDFQPPGDSGSAARFFYCAKASKADRDDGCDAMPTVVTDVLAGHRSRRMEEIKRPDGAPPATGRNHHPTVKPTDLMRWLCRLVTPPGGLILDPFTGSGSTGRGAIAEGFRFAGIELDPEYVAIASARIAAAMATRTQDLEEQFDAQRQGVLI